MGLCNISNSSPSESRITGQFLGELQQWSGFDRLSKRPKMEITFADTFASCAALGLTQLHTSAFEQLTELLEKLD